MLFTSVASLVRLAPGPSTLLGEEDGLDVGQHAALGDRHAGQQLVQLLVVPEQTTISPRNSDYQKFKYSTLETGVREFNRTVTTRSVYLMASWRCLGMMRDFLLSLAAFPASYRISAARYSMTAAMYTGAPAPTRLA